jgi:hypothetical protein
MPDSGLQGANIIIFDIPLNLHFEDFGDSQPI